MLSVLHSYFTAEVWPRRHAILRGSEFWISLSLAVVFAVLGPGLSVADSRLGDLLTVVLAYAAVAFGFCLAGLTVALTLPDAEFAELLATHAPTEKQIARARRRPNAYRDLLFVFSWTAAAHWIVIIYGIGLLAACGFDAKLLPHHVAFADRLGGAALVFVLAYAVQQFFITVVTLSQVGNRYVDELKKRAAAERKER